jgi:hypothetical protein
MSDMSSSEESEESVGLVSRRAGLLTSPMIVFFDDVDFNFFLFFLLSIVTIQRSTSELDNGFGRSLARRPYLLLFRLASISNNLNPDRLQIEHCPTLVSSIAIVSH